MKYYLSEDKLRIVKEDDDMNLYRYDWCTGDWVLDFDLIPSVWLGEDWFDEATEQEAFHAIENRTVPIYRGASS